MTKRERKYHKRKWWSKWIARMIKLSPTELQEERAKVRARLYAHTDRNMDVYKSAIAEPLVTVTITKYNLPNNSSLQKGQLN